MKSPPTKVLADSVSPFKEDYDRFRDPVTTFFRQTRMPLLVEWRTPWQARVFAPTG